MRTYTDTANNLILTSERITAVPGMGGRSIAYERVKVTATDSVTATRIGNIGRVLDFKEVLGICSAKKVTSSAVSVLPSNAMPQFTHSKSSPSNVALQYFDFDTDDISLSSGEYYEFVVFGTVNT